MPYFYECLSDSFAYMWHYAFMCVTWLIHVCDMTHSCVRHDSFSNVRCLNYSNAYQTDESCHTHECVSDESCHTHEYVSDESCHTHEYVSDESCHTHECVSDESCHTHECVSTCPHECVSDSFATFSAVVAPWSNCIHTRAMTHSCVCHDSFIVRHDSFTYVPIRRFHHGRGCLTRQTTAPCLLHTTNVMLRVWSYIETHRNTLQQHTAPSLLHTTNVMSSTPKMFCMYVCMHSCMHECKYVCMCDGTNNCALFCTHHKYYLCMHICMYVCMYVCVYASTSMSMKIVRKHTCMVHAYVFYICK